MDVKEAKYILENELEEYRQKPYSVLAEMIEMEPVNFSISGGSETKYQIEIQAFWDDKPFNNLRVIGSIDDGGIRALSPITDDFIVSPSGEFIGE